MVDDGRYNYSSWGLQTNIGQTNIGKLKKKKDLTMVYVMVDIKRSN
jgi:hypothetical protein